MRSLISARVHSCDDFLNAASAPFSNYIYFFCAFASRSTSFCFACYAYYNESRVAFCFAVFRGDTRRMVNESRKEIKNETKTTKNHIIIMNTRVSCNQLWEAWLISVGRRSPIIHNNRGGRAVYNWNGRRTRLQTTERMNIDSNKKINNIRRGRSQNEVEKKCRKEKKLGL